MMKKIPNGKKIMRQEIEKRMRMLEELSARASQDDAQRQIAARGKRRQAGIIQEDVLSDEDKERIIDELIKCGNKSFFIDQFDNGILQDSAQPQRQIVISHGKALWESR